MILKGIENGFERVDMATVRKIQSLAPGSSTKDAETVRCQVPGGAIFRDFSARERETICENLLAFNGLVPSLFTFFQDVHLLEACADCLKRLVTIPPDKTLCTALKDSYKRKEQRSQRVQKTETTSSIQYGSPEYCKRLGYLELVAYAMRHYPSLPKEPVKKDVKTRPRMHADQGLLQRLASLAADRGFDTPEIRDLMGNCEPPPVLNSREVTPRLVTTGPGESLKRRYGFPRADTFERDRHSLFLQNLCEGRDEIGEGITSFFVLKYWFIAFFNPPKWSLAVGGHEPSPPQPPQPPHPQHALGEDVNMREARPEPSGHEALELQQEPPSRSVDEQMEEAVEILEIEANRIVEGEEEGLFGSILAPPLAA